MKIAIDERRCTGCGLCVEVCINNFTAVPGGKPKAADPVELCIRCGHCVAVCPQEAISHDGLKGLAFVPAAPRPGLAQFMALLKSRRSRREFKETKLSSEEVASLLEAGAQAANGCNRRNVQYRVITDPTVLKELVRRIAKQMIWLARKLESPIWRAFFRLAWGRAYDEFAPLLPLMRPMADALSQGQDVILHNAPCAILIHTRKGDVCGVEDAVYSGSNILLAAEAMGLGACVIGFLTDPVNRDKGLARLAGIPQGHKVHTSIVVGHPRFAYSRGISRPAPCEN